MVRTQIQLEEQVWEKLRARAFQEKKSVAALVRSAVIKELGLLAKGASWQPRGLKFIAIGRAKGRGAGTISVRHDEELVKIFAEE